MSNKRKMTDEMKKMSKKNEQNENPVGSPRVPRISRKIFGSALMWCLIAVLAAVCAFSRFRTPAASDGAATGFGIKSVAVKARFAGADKADARKLAREQEKLLAHVRRRTKEFKADVQAAAHRYERMISHVDVDRDFADARQGVDFLLSRDGLCGFKASCTLAYKFAYDRVKGTTRAQDAIVPLVSAHVLGPVERAVGKYETLTRQFHAELKHDVEAFAMDLAVRSQAFEREISVLSIPEARRVGDAMQGVVVGIEDRAVKTVAAAVGAAVEAALIKSSLSTIGKVVVRTSSRALAGAAARLSASVATGAGCALADGPLPIGDIVGAGFVVIGLGWTAYDIYEAVQGLPDEIRRSAWRELDQTRTALAANTRNGIHGLRDGLLAFADQQAAAIEKSLQ